MTVRLRSAGPTLLFLTGLAGLLLGGLGLVWAGSKPVPARTAQGIAPLSPEPPLADAPGGPPTAPRPDPHCEGTPCPTDPPAPVVTIRVRVAACASAGQELEYRLCVANASRAAAHHVTVRNPLPANARFVRASPEPNVREPELVWQLGTVEGCQCREIVLVLAPTGGGDVKNCARVQFEHGQCVTTKIARPGLALEKRGPARALLWEAITYQLIVTNTGAAELRDVLLTDTLPEGMQRVDDPEGKNQRSWDLGTLAPGQTRRIEYQVIARKTGQLCNQAAVVAAGGLRQEARHCVFVEPRLEALMTGPERRFLNRPATYQITVRNPRSTPATNVVVTNPIPAQTELVRASAGGRQFVNEVRWSLGTIEPGGQRKVALDLKGTVAGTVTNKATVTADGGLSAQAEASTRFEGAAGLTFDIDDRDDPVEVGKETVYTITVTNQGSEEAKNVRIVVTVPAQMKENGVTAPGQTGAKKDGPKITFDPVNLPAMASATYKVFVKPERAGDVRFRVEMDADLLKAGPVTREESTTIYPDTTSESRRLPTGNP